MDLCINFLNCYILSYYLLVFLLLRICIFHYCVDKHWFLKAARLKCIKFSLHEQDQLKSEPGSFYVLWNINLIVLSAADKTEEAFTLTHFTNRKPIGPQNVENVWNKSSSDSSSWANT